MPQYYCYYCQYFANKSNDILHHNVITHPACKLSIRKNILNEHTGELVLKSLHFPINISEVKLKIDQGKKIIIVDEPPQIRFFPGLTLVVDYFIILN